MCLDWKINPYYPELVLNVDPSMKIPQSMVYFRTEVYFSVVIVLPTVLLKNKEKGQVSSTK